MIQQLEVNEESNRYRPDVLCPDFFAEDRGNTPPWQLHACDPALEKEYNIKAVEKYSLKLCAHLAAAARLQYDKQQQLATADINSSSSVLKDNVKLNLEKISAKSFNPSFLQNQDKLKSFESFMEQTRQRTEKYSDLSKDPVTFAKQQEERRNPQKTVKKNDQEKYKDLVQARLSVYKGWEFVARTDGQEGFILRNNVEADANQLQEITVTKNANSSFNIISTGALINDETIAIMLELSHNVIRFSDTKMKMTIQGVETKNVSDKIEEGLAIINRNKQAKERINYTFDKKPDNK